ncbi:MAG: anion permease [Actinobacteria bacterium]|nr:anion permease [Actinomycetota bacterium]
MESTLFLVALIIVVALVFDYTNGFHDAANAIATSVATKAMRVQTALLVAAFGNLVGAFLSEGVAKTVGKGIIDVEQNNHGLTVVIAALVGAITWNLITWWFGLPSSSSHALIGGLVGGALAGSEIVYWQGIIDKVLIPMVLSPTIGFGFAFLLTLLLQWAFRNASRKKVGNGFRIVQVFSAGAMAVGHGLQDAQKTMGVMTLALVVGGMHSGDSIPFWVKVSAASAISLGTYAGGWRIMKTLGKKVIEVDPIRSVAAQSVASTVLYVMAIYLKAPISTTHTITSSIIGAGATRGRKRVSWGVVGNIVSAWVLTLPAAALCAGLTYAVIHLFLF